MKLFLIISTLPILVTSLGHSKSVNFLYDRANSKSSHIHSLTRKLETVRNLQACDFFNTLQLNCSIEEFCEVLNGDDELSTYECGGDLEGTGEWYYKVEDPYTCYEDFQDDNGTVVDPDDPLLQVGAYCSRRFGYFNFTGAELTVTDSTEEIFAPAELRGTIRLVLPISVCSMEESSFFINQPYCIGKCPDVLEINAVECEGICIECDDGTVLPNCGNIDESLVGECGSPAWADDDLTEEFVAFFNRTNAAQSSSAAHIVPIVYSFYSISILFFSVTFLSNM